MSHGRWLYDKSGIKVETWKVPAAQRINYYATYDEYSRQSQRNAENARRNIEATSNFLEACCGTLCAGASHTADAKCWGEPCVQFCCAGMCLAASIASCVDPSGAVTGGLS